MHQRIGSLGRLVPHAVLLALLSGCGGDGDGDPPASGGEPPVTGMSCEKLVTLNLPDASIHSSEVVSEGVFTPPDGSAAVGSLPPFCRVAMTIAPQNNVEVWLPTSGWNGRLQGAGNGGWGGFINYGSGAPRDAQLAKDINPGLADGLRLGFAVASTDTGHVGKGQPPSADGSFGMLPSRQPNTELQNEWSYRAVHEMTVKAKTIINAFYGSDPEYSYFIGCSGGGRQAMAQAQRYPDDYDGIIAGAPAIHWDRYQATKYWMQVVQAQDNGAVIPAARKELATKAAVEACDAKDGITDGVLRDPRLCGYDARQLVCQAGQPSDSCLTATEASAINKMWYGPTNEGGTSRLWYGFPPGTDLEGSGGPVLAATSVDLTKYWVYLDPDWDWRYLNYTNFELFFEDVIRMSAPSGIATDNPDLSAFRDSGAKLLLWHGWQDQLIMPEATPHYYDRVVQATGGSYENTKEFARLYMAPGIRHCSGGSGHQPQDLLEKMMKWVEDGEVPATIRAAKNTAGGGTSSRPLCAYPEVAEYVGTGSTDEAENFVCRPPTPSIP